MKIILNIIISLLPVYVLGVYIYNKDTHKEPIPLIIKLVIGGVLSCALTLCISLLVYKYIPFFNMPVESYNFIELFIYVFFGVALIEELSKFIFVYIIGFRSKEFDESYDAIVYSTMVSLGFAGCENLIYIFSRGTYVGLMRIITALPAHICFGIACGMYLYAFKLSFNQKKVNYKYLLLSLLYPVFLHFVYDYLIFANNIVCVILYYIFMFFMFFQSFKKLNDMAKTNKKILIRYQTLKNK